MQTRWSHSDNFLLKDDCPFMELSERIIKLITVKNLLVVLLDSTETRTSQNIVCFDTQKNFKWKISRPDELHDRNDFTGIYMKDGLLYAYNRNGVEYLIDILTGTFLGSQLIK